VIPGNQRHRIEKLCVILQKLDHRFPILVGRCSNQDRDSLTDRAFLEPFKSELQLTKEMIRPSWNDDP
jgi:3-deoxy-D-arabino-heptulosonate 7-phosphate (DAHP) synthase